MLLIKIKGAPSANIWQREANQLIVEMDMNIMDMEKPQFIVYGCLNRFFAIEKARAS